MQDNSIQIQSEDIIVGDGTELISGQEGTFHYTGSFENGDVFDTSKGKSPFTCTIGAGEVIPGWDMGIPGMKIGGTRKLTIPYQLAYGERGIPGAIPPKSTLIFVVELLGVK
jgi:FKBP-type peptidyl-prolyl cis-trans isomerase